MDFIQQTVLEMILNFILMKLKQKLSKLSLVYVNKLKKKITMNHIFVCLILLLLKNLERLIILVSFFSFSFLFLLFFLFSFSFLFLFFFSKICSFFSFPIGVFANSAGFGVKELCDNYLKNHDDFNLIMVEALADRLAEALAEVLHEKVRKEFWGYSKNESLTTEDLIKISYQVIIIFIFIFIFIFILIWNPLESID